MAQFKWCVVISYDCKLGTAGSILSKHTSYDLAKAAARKTGFYAFLAIRKFNAK